MSSISVAGKIRERKVHTQRYLLWFLRGQARGWVGQGEDSKSAALWKSHLSMWSAEATVILGLR